MAQYTNTSRGPRGIWTKNGLIYIEAGRTMELVRVSGTRVPEGVAVGEEAADEATPQKAPATPAQPAPAAKPTPPSGGSSK